MINLKRTIFYVACIGYVGSLWAAVTGHAQKAIDIFGFASLLAFALFIVFVCKQNKS